MNIKNNLVKPVGILAERQFIAKCINRQNNKRFTSFKSVVLWVIALIAVLAFCISFIGLALHFASFHKSKQQLETEALIQQLEKGEVIEMTARVGGHHD
ncbi:hypothetical protein [Acinetobacter sp. ANC5681]|uniref:hypothetical protein n=1 Tax=Acinetobacter sp. ANC5681 TaxID=2929504 RepID=UPI00201AB765|nr:hypothetical protein [Acinetobacter sp. ANC5681]MCL5767391.1 hypothetical protein [Acinetobacter sp. ANC5681]